MTRTLVIVVLNWNGWQDTLACLESAFAADCPDCTVVVVDNGSTDDSLARIREWGNGDGHARVVLYDRELAERGGSAEEEHQAAMETRRPLVLIRAGANLGFAGGNNIGIRYALARGAKYILLLNNDARFRSPRTLSHMRGFIERTPTAGACGGRLYYPDGTPQHSYGHFPAPLRTLAWLFPLYKLLPKHWFRRVKRSNVVPDDTTGTPLPVDWPSGACLLVRSKMIEQVGLLDERYFLYVEETDWCYRMRMHGWERFYLPQAEIIHVCGGTVRNASLSMRRYHLESMFTYFRKHFSPPLAALMAAGYLLRALFSIPCWLLTARFCRAARRTSAREQALYWQAALKLALALVLHPDLTAVPGYTTAEASSPQPGRSS